MKKMRRNGGFTMLEVVISMAILVIVMGMVYMSLFSSSSEYEANAKRAWIIHQGRMALDEIAEDIRQSNRLTVDPFIAQANGVESPPGNYVSFKKVLAPSALGVAQYTTYNISYKLIPADDTPTVVDAEPANVALIGLKTYKLPGGAFVDSNNNKKIDEYRLVKLDPNPGVDGKTYPAKIMCNNIRMGNALAVPPVLDGFQVRQTYTLNDDKIRNVQIRITLVLIFTDAKNRVMEETLETKVYMRNYK